jgi:hypothetical protein
MFLGACNGRFWGSTLGHQGSADIAVFKNGHVAKCSNLIDPSLNIKKFVKVGIGYAGDIRNRPKAFDGVCQQLHSFHRRQYSLAFKTVIQQIGMNLDMDR